MTEIQQHSVSFWSIELLSIKKYKADLHQLSCQYCAADIETRYSRKKRSSLNVDLVDLEKLGIIICTNKEEKCWKEEKKKTNLSSCQTPKDNKSVANEIVTTLIICADF